MSESSTCIFCNIITGDAPGKLLFEEENYVVIKDIKPAAKHHYLVIPRKHISDVNNLSPDDHKSLLEGLIQCGKQFLEENGGNLDDSRFGFHVPPFNSIAHLHLHVISPASQMSFLSKLIFKPGTWWFQTNMGRILDINDKFLDDTRLRNLGVFHMVPNERTFLQHTRLGVGCITSPEVMQLCILLSTFPL